MEADVLELDPTFAEVQARSTNAQSPLAAAEAGVPAGAFTSIGGGSSGFSVTQVGTTGTLVSPLTTKGDIYVRTASGGTRLPVGADDSYIVADAAETTGLKYIAASPGWNAPTGTLSRGTYAAYAGQVISNPPTQAEVQALDDAVKLMSQTLAAALSDLRAQKRFKA